MHVILKGFLCLILLSTILGCASTSSSSRAWTGDSRFNREAAKSNASASSWQRLRGSAVSAFKNPHTWAPLLGASIFRLDDFDEQTVEWADRHHPIFANRETAKRRSDDLRDLSKLNYAITVATLPSDPGWKGIEQKIRNGGIGMIALSTNTAITRTIKTANHRQRPFNSESYSSFPSGHTSSTATAASLSAGNIAQMTRSPNQNLLWKSTGYSIAALTGWARIEAGVHYPSDVLAGYALGSFVAGFFNELVIHPKLRENLVIGPSDHVWDEVGIGLHYWW